MSTEAKSDQDLVKHHAHSIRFQIDDEVIVSAAPGDFELFELDERISSDEWSVIVPSEITKEHALKMLRMVAAHIRKNGLPETTLEIPRKDATEMMLTSQLLSELTARFWKLPYRSRNRWLSVLKSFAEENHDDEDDQDDEASQSTS